MGINISQSNSWQNPLQVPVQLVAVSFSKSTFTLLSVCVDFARISWYPLHVKVRILRWLRTTERLFCIVSPSLFRESLWSCERVSTLSAVVLSTESLNQAGIIRGNRRREESWTAVDVWADVVFIVGSSASAVGVLRRQRHNSISYALLTMFTQFSPQEAATTIARETKSIFSTRSRTFGVFFLGIKFAEGE